MSPIVYRAQQRGGRVTALSWCPKLASLVFINAHGLILRCSTAAAAAAVSERFTCLTGYRSTTTACYLTVWHTPTSTIRRDRKLVQYSRIDHSWWHRRWHRQFI